MKTLTKSQLIGQQGEHLVASATLAMGFNFDGRNRLETGVDGLLELREPLTGRVLANWIGVQVKATADGNYSHEDAIGFDYLLKPDDLEYWRGSNIPVILVLVRLDPGDMYWMPVDAGLSEEPRRLHFNKTSDRYDRAATDRIAALCVERDRPGSFVPPMRSGEDLHLTMLRVVLPEEVFVAASLYGSGKDAARELAKNNAYASFDWVIRDRRFISFRDPRGTPLMDVIDEGTVECVETEAISLADDMNDEHTFIDLLGRTLSAQFDKDLSYDRDTRALYFRAPGPNCSRSYCYRSLVNETKAEVVSVWRGKDGRIGSVRHHAFIPRFQRIGDEWFMSVTPTFVFTRDGFRPHYNASSLLAGKKSREKEGAIRGQFVMWRHLLMSGCQKPRDLLTNDDSASDWLLRFDALGPVHMPLAVPEDAWRRDDTNITDMADQEWLL